MTSLAPYLVTKYFPRLLLLQPGGDFPQRRAGYRKFSRVLGGGQESCLFPFFLHRNEAEGLWSCWFGQSGSFQEGFFGCFYFFCCSSRCSLRGNEGEQGISLFPSWLTARRPRPPSSFLISFLLLGIASAAPQAGPSSAGREPGAGYSREGRRRSSPRAHCAHPNTFQAAGARFSSLYPSNSKNKSTFLEKQNNSRPLKRADSS